MRKINVTRRKAAVVSMAGMALLAVAFLGADGCAGDAQEDPTPVQTFKITPAAKVTEPPTPSTPVSSATAPVDATQASSTIVVAGISSTFDVEEIDARAGTLTIEFDNRDGGVIHNLHVFRGDDADGESVAESELEVGPVRQTVAFDAQPGDYYYQCDSHPTTMSGTLRVE